MQQISFDNITPIKIEVKRVCDLCNMKCRNHRGCLIGQIMNEVNKERPNDKMDFMRVNIKFPSAIPDEDIAYAISTALDGKRRTGYPFSKAIFGMVKPK